MKQKPTYEELERRVRELEREQREGDVRRYRLSGDGVNGDNGPPPESSSPEPDLESIIHVEDIQAIMDDFYHLTHMTTAILDVKGKIIEAAGWRDICTQFHRLHPQAARNCTQSDLFLAKRLKPGEYVDYKCKNGLWDVVTPLYVGGRHLGNIYAGQFFYDDEDIDEAFFVKQAETYGFDQEAYMEAFRQIPRYSRETVNHLMDFLVKFATYISRICLSNIQLKHEIHERKETEEALKESQAYLRTLIRTIPDLVWLKDAEGVFLFCNSQFERFVGAKEKDIIGKTDYDFVTKELADFFRKNDKTVMASGKPHINEEELVYADDGHKELVETIKTPVFDSDGALVGVLGIARDITGRKQIEEALQKSEEDLKEAQYLASIGSWVHEIQAGTLIWSDEVFRIFGLTPPEFGNTYDAFLDAIHPDDRDMVDRIYQESIKNKTPYNIEHRVLLKNGDVKFVYERCKIYFDDQGRHIRSVGTIQDVTEHKQAEDALKNIARFPAENPYPVLRIRSDGKLLYANPVAKTLLANQNQTPGVAPDDWINSAMAAMDSNDILRREFTYGDKTFAFHFTPFNDVGYVNVYGVNITKQKRVESQLAQSQKMEAVGRLAGGIAHDFNNMLSVILGNADMALSQTDLPGGAGENLREIEKAAERSAELTRQLLAYARKQTIAPKVLNLNDTISEMINMLQRLIGEAVDLAWMPSEALWPVKMDPSQIDQILINLCINAGDAIADVGKITIETDNVSLDEGYCADHFCFPPGEYVLLAVSDNGCGMSDDMLPHVFEPFFTSKGTSEGTGLGLATVHGIVTQNNGFINVYSEPGHGTTFKLYLPRCIDSETTQPKQTKKTRRRHCGGHGNILLVEDEPSLLELNKTILENLGYGVLPASSPNKAILVSEAFKEDIHLLITDVVMPEMNGRELSECLKSHRPELKTLFVSGYTANVIVHHGVLDAGVPFIAKPFSRQKIAEKVKEILDA